LPDGEGLSARGASASVFAFAFAFCCAPMDFQVSKCQPSTSYKGICFIYYSSARLLARRLGFNALLRWAHGGLRRQRGGVPGRADDRHRADCARG
jgi:hypothetical protein